MLWVGWRGVRHSRRHKRRGWLGAQIYPVRSAKLLSRVKGPRPALGLPVPSRLTSPQTKSGTRSVLEFKIGRCSPTWISDTPEVVQGHLRRPGAT